MIIYISLVILSGKVSIMLMIFRQETPADLAALWTIALSMVRSDVGACLYVDDYDGSRCVRVIHAVRNKTHQL